MKTPNIGRDKILTHAELVNLFTHISVVEHRPEWTDKCFLVRFVIGTGCRVAEVAQVRIDEDCEPNGVIHVRHGKGDKYRLVKTTPELFPHYRRRIQEIGHGLLFPRRDPRVDPQKPYTTRTLESWWEDVLREAGVRPLSIHKGRHTWATNELARGLPDFVVRDLAGHSTISITHGFYSHADVDSLYLDGDPEWWAIARGEIKAERKLRVVK